MSVESLSVDFALLLAEVDLEAVELDVLNNCARSVIELVLLNTDDTFTCILHDLYLASRLRSLPSLHVSTLSPQDLNGLFECFAVSSPTLNITPLMYAHASYQHTDYGVCHSRAGGNPQPPAVLALPRPLDSRLRGNDRFDWLVAMIGIGG